MLAISDYDRAIEIDPRDASAFYNRGAVHYELGHHSQAIGDLKTAARLGSEAAENALSSMRISW